MGCHECGRPSKNCSCNGTKCKGCGYITQYCRCYDDSDIRPVQNTYRAGFVAGYKQAHVDYHAVLLTLRKRVEDQAPDCPPVEEAHS